MASVDLPAEAVAAILFGLLQFGIGLISLWQQRELRRAYRKCRQDSKRVWMLIACRRKERRKEIHDLKTGKNGNVSISS